QCGRERLFAIVVVILEIEGAAPKVVDAALSRLHHAGIKLLESAFDRDVLSVAGPLLARRDFQDAVERKIELNGDLITGGGIGEPFNEELPDHVIEAKVLVLALVNLDVDLILVIANGLEDFA